MQTSLKLSLPKMCRCAFLKEESKSQPTVQIMGQQYCPRICENGPGIGVVQDFGSINMQRPAIKDAVEVRDSIDLHPSVLETYECYRTPHQPQRQGVSLPLHYLFQYCAYYQGEWKDGVPHGFGKIIYDDGSIYEGCFQDGHAYCQKALYIRDQMSFYRGAVKQNKANGYGQLSTPKIFYKGQWIDDLPQGKGREIYNSLSYYDGDFVKGVKEGHGFYQWNSTEYYIGKFNKNNMHGQGDLVTKNYRYTGQFREGRKEGLGSYTDIATKTVIKCKFEKNLPTGKGVMQFQDGTIFSGTLQGFNKRKGTISLMKGEIYEYCYPQNPSEGSQNDLHI